jgi:hypothetical protein
MTADTKSFVIITPRGRTVWGVLTRVMPENPAVVTEWMVIEWGSPEDSDQAWESSERLLAAQSPHPVVEIAARGYEPGCAYSDDNGPRSWRSSW